MVIICFFLAASFVLLLLSLFFKHQTLRAFTMIFIFSFFLVWFFVSVIPLGGPKQSIFDGQSYTNCIDYYNQCAVKFFGYFVK